MYGMKEYIDSKHTFLQKKEFIGSSTANQRNSYTLKEDKKLEEYHGQFYRDQYSWYYKDLSERGSFVKLKVNEKIALEQGTVVKFGDEKVFRVHIDTLKGLLNLV